MTLQLESKIQVPIPHAVSYHGGRIWVLSVLSTTHVDNIEGDDR